MIHIGTSGYNYPEWKGSFYPDDLPDGCMLGYDAERFTTVEINDTFYRMPNERTAGLRDVFVYFKHEAQGTGPAFAARLRSYLDA